VKDIAVHYAADWNSIKVAAAFGFSNITDEGCTGSGSCGNLLLQGGGGAPFQGFRRDADVWQVGASIMHVPSGLWAYGLWQQEDNNGTQWKVLNVNTDRFVNSAANTTDVWFVKAGIKRTWTPLGATVIWGEGGQYENMFNQFCGQPGAVFSEGCLAAIATGGTSNLEGVKSFPNVALAEVTGSTVNRYGAGIMQEIDSAAMHVWFNWQHLNLDLNAVSLGECSNPNACPSSGTKFKGKYDDLDMFMLGGVIFF
jgi:hypothetical protein